MKMATFWYGCPTCERKFPYTPKHEREGGHCGHKCLGCETVMDWDDLDMSGQPQECTHLNLKKPGSLLPIKSS